MGWRGSTVYTTRTTDAEASWWSNWTTVPRGIPWSLLARDSRRVLLAAAVRSADDGAPPDL